jgi:hypothetical protein
MSTLSVRKSKRTRSIWRWGLTIALAAPVIVWMIGLPG